MLPPSASQLTWPVKKGNAQRLPDLFPIYEKLGGRDAIKEIVERRRESDKRLSPSTMRMWKRKGKIPGNICQLLQAECQARNIEFSVPYDFEISGEIIKNAVIEREKETLQFLDSKKDS